MMMCKIRLVTSCSLSPFKKIHFYDTLFLKGDIFVVWIQVQLTRQGKLASEHQSRVT